MVVAELELLAVDPAHAEHATLRVGARDIPDEQIGASQLRAQRDDHVARIEGGAGCSREKRRVEHEVGVVDERDASAANGGDPLERASGVEAAEAAARDDDARGHETDSRPTTGVETNVTSVLQATVQAVTSRNADEMGRMGRP
jgi:hypothetical protein